MKRRCGVCGVHVDEAELRVEVASEEVEISHVAVDVVHLIYSGHVNTEQSCPWLGLTDGLGGDFSVFGGLGGSTTAKVLKKFEKTILMHLKHG